MEGASETTRAAELDDVVVTVAAVRYSDQTPVVRVDLEQLAFDDKSYVDLSVNDAMWLARAMVTAVESFAGPAGPAQPDLAD